MSGSGPDRAVIELMGMMNVSKPLANVALTKTNDIQLQITCSAKGLNDRQSQALENYLTNLKGRWEKSLLANKTVFSLSKEICQEIMKAHNLKILGQIVTLGPAKTAPARPKSSPPNADALKPAQDEYPPTVAHIAATPNVPNLGSLPPIQEPPKKSRKGNFNLYSPPQGGPPIAQGVPPPRPQGGPPIAQGVPPPRTQGGAPIAQGVPPPRPQGRPPIAHGPAPIQLETTFLISTSSSSSEPQRVEYRCVHSEEEIIKMCKKALTEVTPGTDFTIPFSQFKDKIKLILEASISEQFKETPDRAPTIEGNLVIRDKTSPKKTI